MGVFARFFSHVGSGTNTGNYYSSMNDALLRLNQEYTMLHYPYFVNEDDSFLEAQANLTDYCMSLLPVVSGKTLLEVGCGNGVQAIYLNQKYTPGHISAIDLNEGNIIIAKKEADRKGVEHLSFSVDDAHSLSTIADNSVDFVINIESAFHYSDKTLFLSQIYRVLKPGGTFVIADILTRKSRGNKLKDSWKRKMAYHHWPIARYMKEFPLANFHKVTASEITPEVIQGFSMYKRWLREMKKQHFIENLILKVFYNIHVMGILYTLKNSRQYYVFTGSKPV